MLLSYRAWEAYLLSEKRLLRERPIKFLWLEKKFAIFMSRLLHFHYRKENEVDGNAIRIY